MSESLAPVLLQSNRPPHRFYAGGAAIDRFRGLATSEPYTPEDWIASTTSVRDQEPFGISTLPSGVPLPTAIAADPIGWLGAEHVARWGDDVRLLVKLLDAGQRLPVHAHPDDAFAAAALGAAHGKAEAWYILEPGTVYLGLRTDADPIELRDLVDRQDTHALLSLLHEIRVQRGDAVLVPPGTLHAIGRSVMLAEVQQPEDQSILLEWEGYDIDGPREGHLGLGFDRALEAVSLEGLTDKAVDALVRRNVIRGSVLPPLADQWFRLDCVVEEKTLPAGFAVVIAIEGTGALAWDGGSLPLNKGTTAVVPASAGETTFRTNGAILIARPPAAV